MESDMSMLYKPLESPPTWSWMMVSPGLVVLYLTLPDDPAQMRTGKD
jgi:hypothetical protein